MLQSKDFIYLVAAVRILFTQEAGRDKTHIVDWRQFLVEFQVGPLRKELQSHFTYCDYNDIMCVERTDSCGLQLWTTLLVEKVELFLVTHLGICIVLGCFCWTTKAP